MRQHPRLSISRNVLLCLGPFIVVPVAAVTANFGPCAGIRNMASGVALLAVSLLGVISIFFGFVRWARMDYSNGGMKVIAVATSLGGLFALLLNAFFAYFSWMSLAYS